MRTKGKDRALGYVKAQRQWVREHGGDLAGYTAIYRENADGIWQADMAELFYWIDTARARGATIEETIAALRLQPETETRPAA